METKNGNKKSTSIKARLAYGHEAVDVTEYLAQEELIKITANFLTYQVNVNEETILQIENKRPGLARQKRDEDDIKTVLSFKETPKDATIVFDGYPNTPTLIDVTHIRLTKGIMTPKVEFTADLTINAPDDADVTIVQTAVHHAQNRQSSKSSQKAKENVKSNKEKSCSWNVAIWGDLNDVDVPSSSTTPTTHSSTKTSPNHSSSKTQPSHSSSNKSSKN
ncbi:unnamed protein product [Mytilus coruscus]|uniref:Uncharacterized protein n=1 Tax=Mytilus coruscus TaxID=42192 RepID=A0A6J8BPT5_MYTCO|nr:unnamed protein product [Mytilus coruscus]